MTDADTTEDGRIMMMCDYGEPKLTTGSNKPAPKRSATSVI